MGFIRTLLIIAVIYLVFRFIFRFLFPVLVKRQINKMTNGQTRNSDDNRKEGDVTINKKKTSNNSGEYTDYEEIE